MHDIAVSGQPRAQPASAGPTQRRQDRLTTLPEDILVDHLLPHLDAAGALGTFARLKPHATHGLRQAHEVSRCLQTLRREIAHLTRFGAEQPRPLQPAIRALNRLHAYVQKNYGGLQMQAHITECLRLLACDGIAMAHGPGPDDGTGLQSDVQGADVAYVEAVAALHQRLRAPMNLWLGKNPIDPNNAATLVPFAGHRFSTLTLAPISWDTNAPLAHYMPHLRGLTVERSRLDDGYMQAHPRALRQIPTGVLGLRLLSSLSLAHCQLSEVPAGIGNLENLNYLDLQNNRITQLGAELSQLQHLVELHVSNNQLTQIPIEVSLLPELRTANFTHNLLTTLPHTFFANPSMRALWASNNMLDALPGPLALSTQMQLLDLTRNRLVQMPDLLITLRGLGHLYLGTHFMPDVSYAATLLAANPTFKDFTLFGQEPDKTLPARLGRYARTSDPCAHVITYKNSPEPDASFWHFFSLSQFLNPRG